MKATHTADYAEAFFGKGRRTIIGYDHRHRELWKHTNQVTVRRLANRLKANGKQVFEHW